ncbi:MAG: polysaccharide deacetylase [Chlamydiae bacterium]|nr:MAG: polysaccharide deacetylase [Chlamydiota bacterium]
MIKKRIYLTIDDAPSSYMSLKVDELVQKNIPAIWYCRGEYMHKHLDHVVYAINQGYLIGNHSYSHPYFSKISLEQAKDEILKTEELIQFAYEKADVQRPYKLFRFPYLDKGGSSNVLYKEQLQFLLKQLGFQKAIFDGIHYSYYKTQQLDIGIDAPWTFDAKEYALFNKHLDCDFFIQRMIQKDPEQGLGLSLLNSSDIVLLHDFEQTHHLFSPMLNKLLEWNVEFCTPVIQNAQYSFRESLTMR